TVAKQFNLQPDELAKFMHMLALARNKCAHDERFFDIKFKERIHTKSRGFWHNGGSLSFLFISQSGSSSYVHV
ncbi:MAG: hypothetical protein PUE95_09720, partial [Lachnospiraceae bacterium]|nr:hypothetical protein [Lachnospiraceae bacterium]